MGDLNELRRPSGVGQSRKRLGRGPGSGKGKTSGKGHKGHKARTGTPHRPWFEGGQMPIQRRLPKRGFNNKNFRREYETVNLRDLERVEEDTITLDVMSERGLFDMGGERRLKVLAVGDVDRKLTIHAHAFSASAREKIEAAGGTVVVVPEASASDSDSDSDADS